MSLATTFVRLMHRVALPPRPPRRISKRPVIAQSRAFDVLLSHVDPARAKRDGREVGHRYMLIVRVWGPDAETARRCAREQFHDRVRHRSPAAHLLPEGPVVLREVEAAALAAV